MKTLSEKTLILLLAAVQFSHVLDFVIMMPLGPQLMRAFAINTQAFSVLVSSYTFSSAVFGIVGAFLIDRFDRKSALLFVYAGFALGTFLCALAPTYESLVGARVFAGAFGGVVNTMVFTIIGDSIPESRRGRAMGTVMAAFSVASVAGIPLGLYFAEIFSWHAPFVALAAGSGLIWTIFLLKMHSMREHIPSGGQPSFASEWRKELRGFGMIVVDANHRRAFALTICLMLAAFSMIPFISPFVVSNAGLPESKLPLIYLCGGVCTFFTSRYFGHLSDRHGKHRVFTILALLSMIPIFALTHLTVVPTAMVLVTTTGFMIFVSGRFVPAMALITSSADPKKRGGFMSVNNAIQHLASGVAAILGGFLMSTTQTGALVGYNKVGYVALSMTFFSLILANRIRSRV